MKPTNKKTGMATLIRQFMKGHSRPISREALYERIGLSPGDERAKAWRALRDFERRGEIERTPTGLLRYKRIWNHKDDAPMREKILKAMFYMAGSFSSTDIRRLVNGTGKSYVEKVIKRLLMDGHIYQTGRRGCAHGAGAERLFNITDRVKFRMEVMK